MTTTTTINTDLLVSLPIYLTYTQVEPKILFQRLLDKLRDAKGLEGLGDLGVQDPPYHWYNSLSNEEKYSLSLYGLDLFRFYALKIRRSFGDEEAKALIEEEVAVNMGTEQDEGILMAAAAKEKRNDMRSKLLEGVDIKRLLEQNDEVGVCVCWDGCVHTHIASIIMSMHSPSHTIQELNSILKALNGEYVLPGVGGDLLRDGTGVLPTGRNIHALDPYRLPSPAAWER